MLYYKSKKIELYLDDCFSRLKKVKKKSVDVIFADPPYFLSDGGVTCSGGKMVSVDKGTWDKSLSIEDKLKFNIDWIRLCKECLKDSGTIWVSGTLHNIFTVGYALEAMDFKIINNITWQKTNPPPNLACKSFTHSTETILWAKKNGVKDKYTFNYKDMKMLNDNKQMKDVWSGSLTKKSEKNHGKHPTQKPLYLLDRIILASSNEDDLILDPFCGSGTTGVSAVKNNRRFIGIDSNENFLEIAKSRIEEVENEGE